MSKADLLLIIVLSMLAGVGVLHILTLMGLIGSIIPS